MRNFGCLARTLIAVTMLFGCVGSVSAAAISGQGTWETTLQARDFDGNTATIEGYYDTALDITWLANANYAGTTMNWTTANAWAGSLNLNGITGWRLPTTIDADGPDADSLGNDGCSYTNFYQGIDCGYNITTHSEMSHMFYVTLGNKAYYSTSGSPAQAGWGLRNTADFTNIQSNNTDYDYYWSATEVAPFTGIAWDFNFGLGFQGDNLESVGYYAWAVHSGDVGASIVPVPPTVPVPATVWLFGSGLVGLLGMSRKRGR